MFYSYSAIENELRPFEAVEKTQRKNKRTFKGQYIDGVRIAPDTVPAGKFMYQCRHSDNGDWCSPVTIEPKVVVNFCGTLILDEEIEFANPNDKCVPIKEWYYTD